MAVLPARLLRLAPEVIRAATSPPGGDTGLANRLQGHLACRESGDRPLCIREVLLPACRL